MRNCKEAPLVAIIFLNLKLLIPRRKQRGINNFKFCHSALDAESSPVFWIPASAGMTNSPQAAGNTTRRDLIKNLTGKEVY